MFDVSYQELVKINGIQLAKNYRIVSFTNMFSLWIDSHEKTTEQATGIYVKMTIRIEFHLPAEFPHTWNMKNAWKYNNVNFALHLKNQECYENSDWCILTQKITVLQKLLLYISTNKEGTELCSKTLHLCDYRHNIIKR